MLIPRAVFKISKGAAKEDCRYATSGVRVERGKGSTCYAVVTDGKKMIIAEWSDEEANQDFPSVPGSTPGRFKPKEGVVISREQWDKAGKAIPPKRITRNKPVLAYCHLDERAIIEYREKHPTNHPADRVCPVYLTTTDGRSREQNEDYSERDHFPSWRDVVPDYETSELAVREAIQVGISPQLLAECCKLVEGIGTDEEFKGGLLTVPIEDKRVITLEGRSAESGVICKAVLNTCGTMQGVRQHIGKGRKGS